MLCTRNPEVHGWRTNDTRKGPDQSTTPVWADSAQAFRTLASPLQDPAGPPIRTGRTDHHRSAYVRARQLRQGSCRRLASDEEQRLHAEGAAWATLAEHVAAERERTRLERVITFEEFAATWLRTRRIKTGPLEKSTRRAYRLWLNKYLLPTSGPFPLDELTPTVILRWYEDELPHDKAKTTPGVLRARVGNHGHRDRSRRGVGRGS